jgi:ATP-dependent exoDNAse (exonuclease V) beta subunit
MTERIFYGKPLTFNAGNHRYYWDGQQVPSVTTIISRLSKPALIQWAADMAVRHILLNVQDTAGTSYAVFEQVCAEARKAHQTAKEDAGDIGKVVHRLAEDIQAGHDVGRPELATELAEATPEQLSLVLNCLIGLKQWFDKQELGVFECERRVFSRQHMYAGTTDRFGVINRHYAVLDFKTGGIYDEAWYQMAGYEVAVREELGITEPIWHYLIHLNKHTGECVPYVRGPNETGPAREVWLSLVQLDRNIRAMPKMPKLKRVA